MSFTSNEDVDVFTFQTLRKILTYDIYSYYTPMQRNNEKVHSISQQSVNQTDASNVKQTRDRFVPSRITEQGT